MFAGAARSRAAARARRVGVRAQTEYLGAYRALIDARRSRALDRSPHDAGGSRRTPRRARRGVEQLGDLAPPPPEERAERVCRRDRAQIREGLGGERCRSDPEHRLASALSGRHVVVRQEREQPGRDRRVRQQPLRQRDERPEHGHRRRRRARGARPWRPSTRSRSRRSVSGSGPPSENAPPMVSDALETDRDRRQRRRRPPPAGSARVPPPGSGYTSGESRTSRASTVTNSSPGPKITDGRSTVHERSLARTTILREPLAPQEGVRRRAVAPFCDIWMNRAHARGARGGEQRARRVAVDRVVALAARARSRSPRDGPPRRRLARPRRPRRVAQIAGR